MPLKNIVLDIMADDTISKIVAINATHSGATRVIKDAGEEAGEMRCEIDLEGTDATSNYMTVSSFSVISVVQ
jgi:hypothetical protein